MKFPKILLVSIIKDNEPIPHKKWVKRIESLSYSNFDVLLSSNTPRKDILLFSNENNYEYISNNEETNQSIYNVQEAIKHHAIDGGYNYLFFLSSNIAPPFDIIEKLLINKKQVIGGVVDHGYGSNLIPKIETIEEVSGHIKSDRVISHLQDEGSFFDGEVKKIFWGGDDCLLIHESVFKTISFLQKMNGHEDKRIPKILLSKKLDVYIDTSIYCNDIKK